MIMDVSFRFLCLIFYRLLGWLIPHRRHACSVRSGCTVIMTTHILEVAERMADRIGVIASGRLIAEGTLTELRQQNGHADTSLEDLFIALVTLQEAA